MKKFLVIIAVLALTMISSVAMAEVTFDGSVEFLMRSITNATDWNDAVTTAGGDYQLTYERLRFGVNAKHEGVKARIQFENDWDTWGDGANGGAINSGPTTTANPNPGFETPPSNRFYTREAWLDFQIPGAGTAHIKVGRQFLQLGNGWFLRSGKYGSDAWLVGLPGKNTVAFVNIKASENDAALADDTDAYALLDNYKIDDNMTVGAYFARARDRKGTWTQNAFTGTAGGFNVDRTVLDNIGVWFNGKLGPVKLQAEVDMQMGEIKPGVGFGPEISFEGLQWVLQATMPIDALTVNATLASGSGDDDTTDTKMEGYVTFLDKDPHYTLVYEYYMATAAGTLTNNKNSGFANTQAISIGADYKINKMFTTGLNVWMLSANEKVNMNKGALSDDLGTEFDLKLNITLYDQLTWNTVVGLFQSGDAYKNAAGKADDVTAVHSVLSYKF